jgi:hypothetical protein
MSWDRRRLVYTVAGSAGFLVANCLTGTASEPALHPDSSLFEPGDFLWTRNRGDYVPFKSVDAATYETERLQWEADRDKYFQDRGSLSELVSPQFLVDLRLMSFDHFRLIYIEGVLPNEPTPFHAGRPATGHVAILGVDGGMPFIVEAMPTPISRVRRISYQAWLAARHDQLIWHGRLRGFPPTARAAIVEQAQRYLDRPYSMFTFSLLSEERFYCSKLIWLSVMKALNTAVDGQQLPYGWLSPKTILYSPLIERLHEPRDY